MFDINTPNTCEKKPFLKTWKSFKNYPPEIVYLRTCERKWWILDNDHEVNNGYEGEGRWGRYPSI